MDGSIMERDCDCNPICHGLSPFMVVDFTADEIAYKSFKVHQNPRAQWFFYLKDYCLANNLLFEDPDFKIENHPIFRYELSTKSKMRWLRPFEIIDDPQFLLNESTTDIDILPGYISSGCLRAALLNLTSNKRAFRRTVPLDNSFSTEEYAGIFHFRFWAYGRWLDVVIDDRLPTLDGKLMSTRSSFSNELWCSLLEKAYAKFLGSYSALKSVTIAETMQDFVGGVTQHYCFKDSNLPPKYFYGLIEKELTLGSMIAAVHPATKRTLDGRLCGSHPIIQTMTSDTGVVCFLHSCEQAVAETNKPSEEPPKQYWLCIEQLTTQFKSLEICNTMTLSTDDVEVSPWRWNTMSYEGMWVSGITAGGDRDHKDSFDMNPSVMFDLHKLDAEPDGKCSVVISLMQKRQPAMELCLVIGFELVSHDTTIVAKSMYTNSREVSCRLQLLPGSYRIIPSTKQPDQNGAFFLRVFTRTHVRVNEQNGFQVVHSVEPLLQPGSWESMIRMFFDLANQNGKISNADLALIIDAHFFYTQPRRKRKSWIVFSYQQSKPVNLSVNKKFIVTMYKNLTVQKELAQYIHNVRKSNVEGIGFDDFLNILAENCHKWLHSSNDD